MYIRAKIKEHYGFISLEPSANLNLSNSTLTFVGLQNGSHRKATRGSCDIQLFAPPSPKLLGFKVVRFKLEPLPLKVVSVLPPQALRVLPDVGRIGCCNFLHCQLRILPLMAPRLVLMG